MLYHVEGFLHVHEARIDITIVSQKVINALNHHPCAHISAASLLVTELEIVQPQLLFKQGHNNPVKNLKHYAAECNGMLVVA